MRPHLLRVTAFGAFAGTLEIDFDGLADSGLFLLHGETGAGKTTLLDAIGFALYGRVPGERGKVRRLRSDHAAAVTRTEVRLEVTAGGRRLRITRSPEQARPKRRGNGTTTEPPKVLLEQHTAGTWQPLSSRAGEADAEIADSMGMSAEQFFQVVLLPQGEFARFLHSGSDERGKLLERLFGTDQFRAVEAWLAERRRASVRLLEQARHDLARLAARVAQVAGVPAPDGDPDPTWAADLTIAAESVAATAQATMEAHKRDLDTALRVQREVEQRADKQRRRLAAQRRHAELAAATPQVEALRRELAAASRAAEVDPTLREAARTAARLASARRYAERARAATVAAGADPGASIDALRAAADERRQRVGRLEALRELAERAAAEDGAAAEARRRAAGINASAARCGQRINERVAARARLIATRDSARRAADRSPETHARAQRHRTAATEAAAMATAREDEQRVAGQHTAAREAALARREEALKIREARFEGMIAELAAGLVDGTPCPVCGSLDHPDPSEVRAGRVTFEQEEQANAAAEACQSEAERMGQQLAAASARVKEMTARLTEAGFPSPDPATLDTEAASLEAAAAELAAAAERLPAHETALTALDEDLAQLHTRLAALTEQVRAAHDEAVAADQRAAGHRATLRAQLDGAPDLDAALAAARASAEMLFRAADAAADVRTAQQDADRAASTAESAARAAGFPDAAAARSAAHPVAWRAEAQSRVEAHTAEVAAVQARLADPDLDVPLEPPAGVAAAAETVRVAHEEHERAVARHTEAWHRATQLRDLTPRLAAGLADLGPLVARGEEIRRLADLAAGLGANTLRMTLSSFVLAARLEEVASAASQRLLRMTQGRYTLVHTDTRRGGSRAGLGLLARDAWTGQDRDTSTLSGGETFLASLALALGLTDVVTAEAGGSRIEALFVDEGFGTLDEDTLDEVMNVLDALREGGRIVGVVSHVAELRQRIPTQVRVRKGRTGSTAAIVAG